MITLAPAAGLLAPARYGFAFSPDGRHGACIRVEAGGRALERWNLPHAESPRAEQPRHRTVPEVLVDRETRALPLDDGRLVLAQRIADGRGYELALLEPGTGPRRIGEVAAPLGVQLVADPAGLGFAVALDGIDSTIWRLSASAPWLTEVARVPGTLTGGSWLDDGLLALNQVAEATRTSGVLVDVADGSWRRIWSVSDDSIDRIVLADPGSGLFAVTTTAAGGERLGWGRLGERAVRFPEVLHRPGYRREALALDERGERVLVHEVDGAVSRLYAYRPADDSMMPLSCPAGTVSGPASWVGEVIRVPFSAPDRPATLATVRLGERLHRSWPHDPEPAGWATAELVDVPGAAGPLEAIVYGGPHWARSERLVLALHGGPLDAWRFEFDPLFQCLAAAGVAVVAPNYRGSTGYGEDHLRAVVGDWGGPDLEDVLHLRRSLEAERAPRGLPAPVVLGASYGAYLALLAACRKPASWAGCVALAPFLSGPRLHAGGDAAVRHRVERLGGLAPAGAAARDRDVLELCGALSAPLLVAHGTADLTVPVEQSRALHRRLDELGRSDGPDLEYLEVDTDHDGVVHARRAELRDRVLRFCLSTTEAAGATPATPTLEKPTQRKR